MKHQILKILLVIVYSYSNGQDSLNLININNISISSCLGYGALIDNNISEEKYSGNTYMIAISNQKTKKNHYQNIFFNYRNLPEYKNYKISSASKEFDIGINYSYPIRSISIFSHDFGFLLGPSIYGYYHLRKQNIAGDFYAYSRASMLSLGFNIRFESKITKRLYFQNIFRFGLVTMTARSFSTKLYPDKKFPFQILSPVSSLNATNDLRLLYEIYKRLSIGLLYNFSISRITQWEYFISANDNLGLTLLLKLK